MRRLTLKQYDRAAGSLIGLVVGDAIGATNEFRNRQACQADPVTGLVGGGPWELQPGDWTDDTSMALGALKVLKEQRLPVTTSTHMAIMDEWLAWYESRQAKRYHYLYGAGPKRGRFDVGNTCAAALDEYASNNAPTLFRGREGQSGNGCIMRLAPYAIWHAVHAPELNDPTLFVDQCRTTHGGEMAKACTVLMAEMLVGEILGENPNENVLFDPYVGEISKLAKRDLVERLDEVNMALDDTKILSGGYVLDTLSAAIWCVNTTKSFKDAVLKAVNLGGDADTTAAVAGQLAGSIYGLSAIPVAWTKVRGYDTMRKMFNDLLRD